jgi:hypothetical protein
VCLVLFCVVLGERKANKSNLVKFVCHRSCLNLWEKKGYGVRGMMIIICDELLRE